MAMKLLTARERDNSFVLRVHLDDTKLVNGQPDPDWVKQFVYGNVPPANVTRNNYIQHIRRDVKGLCELEIARRNSLAAGDQAGIDLGGEGAVL
jgi:hypothetical protein